MKFRIINNVDPDTYIELYDLMEVSAQEREELLRAFLNVNVSVGKNKVYAFLDWNIDDNTYKSIEEWEVNCSLDEEKLYIEIEDSNKVQIKSYQDLSDRVCLGLLAEDQYKEYLVHKNYKKAMLYPYKRS